MEYVVVDFHVDIFGINKGTIEIENAGTNWREGGPRRGNVHCLWFVYKRVRSGLSVDSSDILQLLRQSSCRYCKVEAQPRIKMLLRYPISMQEWKSVLGSACFKTSSALPELTQALSPHSIFTTHPLLRQLPQVVDFCYLPASKVHRSFEDYAWAWMSARPKYDGLLL